MRLSPLDTRMVSSLYECLQVSPRAEPDVIRAAYRVLARNHHPDRSTHADALQRMRQLNAAYEVLSDPRRRAQYDAISARHIRAHGGKRVGRMRSSGDRPGRSVVLPVEHSVASPVAKIMIAIVIAALLAGVTLTLWLICDGL